MSQVKLIIRPWWPWWRDNSLYITMRAREGKNHLWPYRTKHLEDWIIIIIHDNTISMTTFLVIWNHDLPALPYRYQLFSFPLLFTCRWGIRDENMTWKEHSQMESGFQTWTTRLFLTNTISNTWYRNPRHVNRKTVYFCSWSSAFHPPTHSKGRR